MEFKDLTGNTYGKLTVLGFVSFNKWNNATFCCKCSCGNPELKIVSGGNLNSKEVHTISCGRCAEFKFIGKTFGKLTVEAFHHRNGCSKAYVTCVCSCGNPERSIVETHALTRNKRKPINSCGVCQQFELPGQTFGKLTVVSFHHRDAKSKSYFLCSCSCGNSGELVIQGHCLISGHSTQCDSCANKLRTRIGKNEHRLLKLQEKQLNIKIQRQVSFGNYVVDGYCKETNTIFEVYEKCHDKTVEKDLQRQQDLEKLLSCNFVIIPDRTH